MTFLVPFFSIADDGSLVTEGMELAVADVLQLKGG
jgi:hypothetical protein